MSICRSMAGQAVRKVKQVQTSVVVMISNQIIGIKTAAHHLQITSVYSYYPFSRAEVTIKREHDEKRRTSDFPAGFIQNFVTSTGVNFPCHPADEA